MYDAVVVGLGVMGSATLCAMAKRGANVLGVEQFSLPHSRGSSHGHGRICRIAYPELQYSQMALAAWAAWERMEEEAGTRVIVPTGGLDFGPRASLQPIVDSLTAVGVAFEVIDAAEIHRRFRGLSLPGHYWGVYTPKAGPPRLLSLSLPLFLSFSGACLSIRWLLLYHSYSYGHSTYLTRTHSPSHLLTCALFHIHSLFLSHSVFSRLSNSHTHSLS